MMMSAKLSTRPSARWLMMALTVELAVAVALSMAFASDAEAKNQVQCPTGGSSYECVGTSARDYLMGRDDTYDYIQGGEASDTYDGKGSCDALYDASLKSSDHYVVSVKDFCNVGISSLSIRDNGGRRDVLDLSGFYKSSDFVFYKGYSSLHMDGPGVNDIDIINFFTPDSSTTDSIDVFKFSDKTLTAKQVKNMSL